MIAHDQETIVAQCTPTGPGAIALIRVSGDNALTIANACARLHTGKNLDDVKSHTIHYGSVITRTGAAIDHVLFLIMKMPHSFTGQNTVEITCHNNPFIIEQIIGTLIEHGARSAERGEFSKRAVLNNKIDVIQAEAINELIQSNTQLGLKKSLAQLDGTLSHHITGIELELRKCLALSEASFEFIDEEDLEFNAQIAESITQLIAQIAQLKINFDQQKHLRDGIRIALIGSVNAGKSSLFNALIGDNRAIVTNVPGTTRDSVQAGIYRNGAYWSIIDTAGLRESNDIVEQEGIKRSFDEAQKADIVLLIADQSRAATKEEQLVYESLQKKYAHKIICIHNKCDLPAHRLHALNEQSALRISTTDQRSLTSVSAAIDHHIMQLFSSFDSPFLLNKRQFDALIALNNKLCALLPLLEKSPDYELISYHLNDALAITSQLTGASISNQAMDDIFRQFCVGK